MRLPTRRCRNHFLCKPVSARETPACLPCWRGSTPSCPPAAIADSTLLIFSPLLILSACEACLRGTGEGLRQPRAGCPFGDVVFEARGRPWRSMLPGAGARGPHHADDGGNQQPPAREGGAERSVRGHRFDPAGRASAGIWGVMEPSCLKPFR